MGNKGSSSKKDKASKKEKKSGEGSKGAANDRASVNTTAQSEGDDGENIWDRPTIYSESKEKVTLDSFDLLTVIGKGSFGKVMQVRKKDDGKIYAMKILRKDAVIERNQVEHTRAEKSILQQIKHPFIVNLRFAFQTEGKLYLVMDFVNGGELFFHLKKENRFSEDRVRLYVAEIASAIDHLHNLDIVYRDLKPENILLDAQGHICITDFGLSKKLETSITDDDGKTHTFCGTPEYLAPEVLQGVGHGKGVDWWSLGTLMYEMLTGLPPFYSQNVNVMYHKILNAELRFPAYVSPDAKNLIEGLLHRDPNQRLEGARVKTHSFFASLNWEDVDARKYQPQFKPKVKSESDSSQIDPMFTQERPVDSVMDPSQIRELKGDTSFEGFTYVGESHMDGKE
eukprot:TRINITY_DN1759_c0_g1_i1.p1 TRINITY_DN1759_c0_g1~~TRINITY_DN1759_c0_g1_i1.p1  ORF type:complete len:397 (-),score=105.82 TRINITY_DN1759_c0_g1_i1:291-1481(-)